MGEKLENSIKDNIWVISDGTKGMENQSLALAKLLNKSFKLIKYNPPYLLKKFPLTRILFIFTIKDNFLKKILHLQ